MRDTGMIRLTRPNPFQDRRSFELVGIGLVGRRRRNIESKRVVNLRFVVIWIALRQLFHLLEVSQYTCAMIKPVVIGVHGAERVDVVALALGLGADRLALLDRSRALLQV